MPRMTGNRYFAEAMRGYGVTHLFYVRTSSAARCRRWTRRRQDGRHPRREGGRVHGRRLRARLAQAGHLPLPGHRHDQPRGRACATRTWRARPSSRSPAARTTCRATATPTRTPRTSRPGTASPRPTSPSTPSSAFPTCCGRRSATPPAARPARCTSSCAATPARCSTARASSISYFEERFPQYPAFRPEAEPVGDQGRGRRAGEGVAADHRRRRRRRSPPAPGRRSSSSPSACRFPLRRPCTRRRSSRTIIRWPSACPAATRAGARTRRWRRPTSSSSSAATPAAR